MDVGKKGGKRLDRMKGLGKGRQYELYCAQKVLHR
jgi:hypothetical protein